MRGLPSCHPRMPRVPFAMPNLELGARFPSQAQHYNTTQNEDVVRCPTWSLEHVFLRTHNTTQNEWSTQHQTNRKDNIMFKGSIACLSNYRHLVYYMMVVKGTVSSMITYLVEDGPSVRSKTSRRSICSWRSDKYLRVGVHVAWCPCEGGCGRLVRGSLSWVDHSVSVGV